ncbi:MAG: DNA methyltransferase [Allosphingosinicella sp.]
MDLRNHPHIEIVKRSLLKPNPKNPRKHSPASIERLARSFDRFGVIDPIIVDEDGLIVAGHGRWLAAGLRGIDEVPVIRVRFMTEVDRRAYAVAANRLAELSEWDEELLAAELEFLFEQDFDLGVTGFEVSDLDFAVVEKAEDGEPPIELPGGGEAVCRPGDLWHIGPHRLFCGNARDAVSYEALLAGELAALVFGDPPYNVTIGRNVSGLGGKTHAEFLEASGEMSPPEFTAFLRAVFRNCVRFSRDGSIHYHCMDWRHTREMLDAADGVYSSFKQLAVWTKTNAGMGAFYRSQHELVFIFKSGTGRHVNNFGLGEKGRHRSNVWAYAGANTFRKGRDQDLADHPTVKPVAMVVDALLDCSNRGDLVLDPFCGAGTTLLAAHRTKRRGAAIELDPLYVDTALRRLSAATGLTPALADGRSWDVVEAARRSGEPANV